MSEYLIKDSGERQSFQTGAVRDLNSDKGDFSLLPCLALAEVARHFQLGAKKYAKANWKKGIPLSRYTDSALRHLFKYLNGEEDENHLVSSAWNLLCALETRELIRQGKLPKELDDLFEIQTGYTKEEYQKKFESKFIIDEVPYYPEDKGLKSLDAPYTL